jgi:hypothetical protein
MNGAAMVFGADDRQRLGGEPGQIGLTVTPPKFDVGKNVFSVTTVASLPARMSCAAIS